MKARIKLLITVTLASMLGLSAFAAFNILSEPSLSESEIEAIARAWAEDNMDGAAGDELVEFIVANTTVNSQSLLREYLKMRAGSGATWSYGPFESAERGSYEASATVALRLSDIMPIVVSDEIKAMGEDAESLPVKSGNIRDAFTLTFLLTVDPASKSVTEWRVHDGKAVYVHFPPTA